jgi:hypothetical protein
MGDLIPLEPREDSAYTVDTSSVDDLWIALPRELVGAMLDALHTCTHALERIIESNDPEDDRPAV